VVTFEFEWKHAAADLLRAMNANLPADVAVKALAECAADFHPRYSAKARHYRYSLYCAPARAPLLDRYAWHVPFDLALPAMQAASQGLMGRHDFAAFGDDPDEGSNTVRTVTQARWACPLGAEPGRMDFHIQAEAFLHRMVRSLVGALKRVGEGSLSVDEFGAILESRDRGQCPAVAPPQGLCLMEILY
jgi:tRNA pseudouridine38-40 synthase